MAGEALNVSIEAASSSTKKGFPSLSLTMRSSCSRRGRAVGESIARNMAATFASESGCRRSSVSARARCSSSSSVRKPGRDLVGAIGHQEQERCAAALTRHPPDELERVLVTPVQVLERDQQRADLDCSASHVSTPRKSRSRRRAGSCSPSADVASRTMSFNSPGRQWPAACSAVARTARRGPARSIAPAGFCPRRVREHGSRSR